MDHSDCEQRRTHLRHRYGEVRGLTDALAEPLTAEDQTVQSMPDVSPTKWHRGHTSWFFETFVLEPQDRAYRTFHPAFRYIFNSYYEAIGPRHPRPERGLLSRPGAAEVAAYRRHVDTAMERFFDVVSPPDVLDLVELGLHHEQQHQELLLMDIKHVLSCNPLRPSYADAPTAAAQPAGEPSKLGWIEHTGGTAEAGHGGDAFAFDNESPRHLVQLVPFALADRLVTCGEWQAFIDDGGYMRPDLWLSEGWSAVQEKGWTSPLYWETTDGAEQRLFTLTGERDIDPAEPVVHVSYYEADAFARWSGARLPTEPEWETLAAASWREGSEPPRFGLHPTPSSAEERRFFGDVWQWTASAYGPYPGFRPAAGAVGEYNGKFMVNQQVLRGSACITPPGHARPTYRNFFPAGARWAFSGVRLARDL